VLVLHVFAKYRRNRSSPNASPSSRTILAQQLLRNGSLQLSTGGKNILPARTANEARLASLNDFLKRFYSFSLGRAIWNSSSRVERDQVDLSANAPEQLHHP
jgi:hypothetical protein